MSAKIKICTKFSDLLSEGKVFIASMQRGLDKQRVNAIVAAIEKEACHPSIAFEGIKLCRYGSPDPSLYVVDGQHRLAAYEMLEKKSKNNCLNYPFHVFIQEVKTKEQMRHYFKLINSGVPVPDYFVDANSDEESKFFIQIEQYLHSRESKEIKYANKKVNRPSVNVVLLVDTFRRSKYYTNPQFKIATLPEFISLIGDCNSKLEKHYKIEKNVKASMRGTPWFETCVRTGDFMGVFLSHDYHKIFLQ